VDPHASTSGLIAGLIIDDFGYSAAFLEAAVAAGAAFGVLATLMPETARDRGTAGIRTTGIELMRSILLPTST
jgi:hypothetical protein